ncbi:MAG: hypothetical protein LBQ61_07980 [Spirochaetales bacterium]|jgi:hypothetical protein|nr:hypothetical protein [Spirochaetales bacterium]
MATKALDLFQAYAQGQLDKEGGYIVSSFFDNNSNYSRYEVVAYAGVKDITLTAEGLTFQTDGNKLHILVEPANYAKKFIEPVSRETGESIPHRFSELNIFSAKNQSKVMVSKKPVITYSSFTILNPSGMNFSIIFYNLPDVLASLQLFFEMTLNREAGIPQSDSKKAASTIIDGVKRFGIW